MLTTVTDARWVVPDGQGIENNFPSIGVEHIWFWGVVGHMVCSIYALQIIVCCNSMWKVILNASFSLQQTAYSFECSLFLAAQLIPLIDDVWESRWLNFKIPPTEHLPKVFSLNISSPYCSKSYSHSNELFSGWNLRHVLQRYRGNT